MKKRGFTLVELLVVIAIIGLLSSIVIASVSKAREKAQDAKIKSQMISLRTQMAIFYSDNGNSYNGGFNSDCWGSDDSKIATILNAIGPDDGCVARYAFVSDSEVWVAASKLSNGFFCVDSTGAARVLSVLNFDPLCPES